MIITNEANVQSEKMIASWQAIKQSKPNQRKSSTFGGIKFNYTLGKIIKWNFLISHIKVLYKLWTEKEVEG